MPATFTIEAAREALAEFWIAGVPTALGWSATQYVLGNKTFVPPAPTVPPTAPTVWARFVVRELASRQLSMGPSGTRRWERRAVAITQLFGQQGAGEDFLDQIAQTVRMLFEGADVGPGIPVFEATVNEIGLDKFGWYQYNINATCRYYEVH